MSIEPRAYVVREPRQGEIDACYALVHENWGDESAGRFYDQFVEYLHGGEYAPKFFVAVELARVVGFCAMRKSMLMNGGWEFIWIAIAKDHQGNGIGEMLTDYRLQVVRENGGTFVLLVTQKPKYFNRFGFITSQDLGNGWVAMTAQLKMVDMK